MKTTPTQFEIMVNYMERYGDLSKMMPTPRGKVVAIQHWDKLTGLLNSAGDGATKTTEKWKKVWTDYKNNTKKKASKLNLHASGTGGGPACKLKLTDLEEKVMAIIGNEAATGMEGVTEAGLHEEARGQEIRAEIATAPPLLSLDTPGEGSEHWNESGPSSRIHISPQEEPLRTSPIPITTSPAIIHLEDVFSESTGPSHSHVAHEPRQLPAQHGQTTPQRRTERSVRSRTVRRRPRQTYTEEASQQFLQSDVKWRNFRIEQHHNYMAMRREQNRIRELEVANQRAGTDIVSRALGLLETLVINIVRIKMS